MEDKKKALNSKNKKVQRFEEVDSLNLMHNLDLNVQDAVKQVKFMFPNLKSFDLSLALEEDVSFIIDTLPKLEFLNGILVEKEEIVAAPQVVNNDVTQDTIQLQMRSNVHRDSLVEDEKQVLAKSLKIQCEEQGIDHLVIPPDGQCEKVTPPES